MHQFQCESQIPISKVWDYITSILFLKRKKKIKNIKFDSWCSSDDLIEIILEIHIPNVMIIFSDYWESDLSYPCQHNLIRFINTIPRIRNKEDGCDSVWDEWIHVAWISWIPRSLFPPVPGQKQYFLFFTMHMIVRISVKENVGGVGVINLSSCIMFMLFFRSWSLLLHVKNKSVY